MKSGPSLFFCLCYAPVFQVEAPGNKRKGEACFKAHPTAPGWGDPYGAGWAFIQVAPRAPSAPLHPQISYRGVSCVFHSHVLVPSID